MEQMKAAGALRIIENRELVNKITTYEALTRHLDEDYRNDRSLVESASNLRDSVVDSNYPDDEHLRFLANESLNLPIEERLALWHENYEGPQLPLLTNDMTDVNIMVNKYGKLVALRARVENEIPRLISLAEEPIQSLEDEYSIDK